MPVLAVIVVLIGVVLGVSAIVATLRRHRTPPELRGDWWAAFEREFRAYATQAAKRDRRRHRGERA